MYPKFRMTTMMMPTMIRCPEKTGPI